MGFFSKFFGPIVKVGTMAKAEAVAAHVPPTASYATIGPVMLYMNAAEINGGEADWDSPDKLFERGNGRDFGYTADKDGVTQELCYLVLDGETLRAISETGEYFSIDAHEIYALDAKYEGSSFLLFMKDGRGLAIGSQTPVEIPPGFHFATISGWTNKMSGWDKILEPFGTKSTF